MTISDIRAELKKSMIQKDAERTSVIRMLLSSISYSAMSKQKKDEDLTEDEINDIILKEIKTRKETVEEFEAANDVDRATKEKAELAILEEYAPKLMSEDEVKVIIDEVLSQNSGLQMGPAMGMVMKEIKLKGKADPSLVQKLMKERYS